MDRSSWKEVDQMATDERLTMNGWLRRQWCYKERHFFGRGIKMEKKGWLPDFRFGFVTAQLQVRKKNKIHS
ncbi:hypothetical protein NC653_040480 [Populus alba x Populus x berolinensis]|uniref:Uncharacterized protein n=1 Tax=Populus alba x Populus x berolinensis TaxID=444605 RepID=A0AAD6L693_9ROSI|nr:hypothetical protein NC653_040480 [Populus alba x Populus x berolinensis]